MCSERGFLYTSELAPNKEQKVLNACVVRLPSNKTISRTKFDIIYSWLIEFVRQLETYVNGWLMDLVAPGDLY